MVAGRVRRARSPPRESRSATYWGQWTRHEEGSYGGTARRQSRAHHRGGQGTRSEPCGAPGPGRRRRDRGGYLPPDRLGRLPPGNAGGPRPDGIGGRGSGPAIVAAEADVRDAAALRAAVASGVARLGSVDIVVANAGIGMMSASAGEEQEIGRASWR